mgnify:CR=1 FL=1
MRHLMSPLDFSVEELETLKNTRKNMHMHVKGRSWLLYFMNQVRVHV